ncbi:MAG: hypothetical protein WD048_09250 [Chitinophagales bacterium]
MQRQLVYTPQAKAGLKECLSLLEDDVSEEKLNEIKNAILDKAEILKSYPFSGQEEPLSS